MLDVSLTDLIPEDLRTRAFDALVDVVAAKAKQLLGPTAAERIAGLRSDAAFRRDLQAALSAGCRRFINEYVEVDEDLVADLSASPGLFADETVARALVATVSHPGAPAGPQRETLLESFASVLPARRNRDRVDRALTYLLRCVAEELWLVPALRPVYSLLFQRITAESLAEQVALQRQQLATLRSLDRTVAEALVQLTEVLVHPPASGALAQWTPPPLNQNLPSPEYARFVGREAELDEICRLLRPYPHSQEHVIAIEGPPGIGKTTLALEAARRMARDADGLPPEERYEAIIWTSAKQTVLTADGIVPRPAPLRALADLFTTISLALGREDIIRAEPARQPDVVRDALRKQRTLLVLDNLEDVSEDEVLVFVRELPAPTKAIVTSRHRVDVAVPIRLSGMNRDAAQHLIESECSRRRLVLAPGDDLRIFQRTHGVPLAIVWTLARVTVGHSLDVTLEGLGRAANDVTRYCFQAALESLRQKDAERVLLTLALLPASTDRCLLAQMAALAADETRFDEALVELEHLSLVSHEAGRLSILPLVRQYTLEGSDPAQQSALLLQIARCYAKFARTQVGDEREHSARLPEYEALENERPNLLAAVDWCYNNRHWDEVKALVGATGYFLHARGYWQDAMEYWQLAASAARETGDPLSTARYTAYLGYMCHFRGDTNGARRHVQQAAKELTGVNPGYQLGSIRRLEACIAEAEGDTVRARDLLLQALAIMRTERNSHGTARILNDLGALCIKCARYDEAQGYLDESLQVSDRGDDLVERTRALRNHARLCQRRGSVEAACAGYEEALAAARQIGWHDEVGEAEQALADLEWRRGHGDRALQHAEEAARVYESLGLSARVREVRDLIQGWGL